MTARIVACSVTEAGAALARRLPYEHRHGGLVDTVRGRWAEVDGFVLVCATGIAVRAIGPLLADKAADPAVVVVDDGGRFAIALSGGHRGGANDLAREVAALVGAEPVVTTATDAAGLPAVDTLPGFTVAGDVAAVTRAWLDGTPPSVIVDPALAGWPLPPELAAAACSADGASAEGRADDSAESLPAPSPASPARTASPVRTAPPAGAAAPAGAPASPARTAPPAGSASPAGAPAAGTVLVTDRDVEPGPAEVVLHPKSLVLGVGSSRGADPEALHRLAVETLAEAGLSLAAVGCVATVDRKADEPAIVELAAALGVGLRTFPAERLATIPVPTPSEVVKAAVGTPSVAEAAALAAGGARPEAAPAEPETATGEPEETTGEPETATGEPQTATGEPQTATGEPQAATGGPEGTTARRDGPVPGGAVLVVEKRRSAEGTIAVARRSSPEGHLAVVGLGPGDPALRTPAAAGAVRHADVVIGYGPYVDLAADLLAARQEVVRSPIGAETERVTEALERAAAGQRVALVCSGDPGVYAMASLVCERAAGHGDPPVTVVPGVTAALAAASVLGAPLGHDHAAVSLSDLLTPWEVIERRLQAVAEGDFAVSLYNPRSKRRTTQLDRALQILAAHRPAATPAAILSDVGRPGQHVVRTTLAALDPGQVDMLSLVVVGSSTTRWLGDRMVTPRGYRP